MGISARTPRISIRGGIAAFLSVLVVETISYYTSTFSFVNPAPIGFLNKVFI
jgi:hypothetical protein